MVQIAAGPVRPSEEDMERLGPLLEAHKEMLDQQEESLDPAQLAQTFEPLVALVRELQSSGARRLLQGAATDEMDVPYLTLSIMLVGFGMLGWFLFKEYKVAGGKQASTHTTLLELVAYRLDYHFSVRVCGVSGGGR